MTSYDVWLSELDNCFNQEFAALHSDFPEYNWFDEFDNDVDAVEAFEEWKLLTECGTREL